MSFPTRTTFLHRKKKSHNTKNMIKRTLCFSNPARLSLKNRQLVVKFPDEERAPASLPIEDLGVVVLDCQQITVTQGLIGALLENNCAVIACDSRHLPVGLMLPLSGNTVQSERFRSQIDASLPLKKQLWQQTVQCKIRNQAAVLEYSTGSEHKNMLVWAKAVRSGDPENLEGRAAAYYWKTLFAEDPHFVRDQEGEGVNALLNYGYAILRATIARTLVCSGLLPTLGIHHHNRYNAYCLADDIMEPYRPYVDKTVLDMLRSGCDAAVNTSTKTQLLSIPTLEVSMDAARHPLMVAASLTTSSLSQCFSGEKRVLSYPEM